MNHTTEPARSIPKSAPDAPASIRPIFQWAAPAVLVLLVMAGYLFSASRTAGIGYPLDDAWIHQTYARNLVQLGQWSFVPGQPSAGSTAPLWSILLAAGYLLRVPHFAWTFLLGGLSLFALSLAGENLFRKMILPVTAFEQHPHWLAALPWAAVLLASEWHLAWAATSGMETLLFGLFILIGLSRVFSGRTSRDWFITGLWIGLSVWIRPDGITLLGPAGFTLLLASIPWRERLRSIALLAAGAAALFIPYLVFNLLVQGSLWPNTFYAKQAEYAVLRQMPLITRFFNEIRLPLIGGGIFLLPGFLVLAARALREKRWPLVAVLLWFFGYALLYAMRLPVSYQYGRYFMPAMPIYFVVGLSGTFLLLKMLPKNRIAWAASRVLLGSGLLVWLAFTVIGAGRYAHDAALIETEMVAAARWVEANTEPQALIAAHDIGALGYFGNRRILDLAGLISPEVIPFIRDETAIAAWMDKRQADYLVVFANWYKHLPEGKPVRFETSGEYSIPEGGGSTLVLQWRP